MVRSIIFMSFKNEQVSAYSLSRDFLSSSDKFGFPLFLVCHKPVIPVGAIKRKLHWSEVSSSAS